MFILSVQTGWLEGFASIYEVYGRFDCTCFAITDQYYQSVLDIF